ncbi:hypothetical protein JXB41_03700 [Candidatus Woesearchaeota archaeon]|nr:hypothetical protein [Candidatus Woesearchaeota archaeon]
MFKEVIKLFERRKDNLINLLETNSAEIDAGKQHQLYGAILEIDFMIKTLQHHNDRLAKENLTMRKDKLLKFD